MPDTTTNTMYPLISEYRAAILSPEDSFQELATLRPVLDSRGFPVMSSGNFAVVFKMKDENDGKLYAVKCFLKDQSGRDESYRRIAEELEVVSSAYILPLRYLEGELFVDSPQCSREEFPVVVMEWVEGETLDAYVRRNLTDKYALATLSYRFNRMAAWLLAQPFAHGDLKPDNIIVRADGTLVMVDYDGMFVLAMKGEKARETGSPGYRHPLRTDADFSEHIDDFSIALIALSLKALSLRPDLKELAAGDALLLSEDDLREPGESAMLKEMQSLASDPELATLLGVFYIALAKNSLEALSFRLFMTPKPKVTEAEESDNVAQEAAEAEAEETETVAEVKEKMAEEAETVVRVTEETVTELEELKTHATVPQAPQTPATAPQAPQVPQTPPYPQSPKVPDTKTTYCWPKEIAMGVADEYGVIYSRDGKRLLKCSNDYIFEYQIKPGTEVICSFAFKDCKHLERVVIPPSVTLIGRCVFSDCTSLKSVSIPPSVTYLEANPFEGCGEIRLSLSPESRFRLIDGLLIDENGVLISCLNSSSHISIPSSVTSIGHGAFSSSRSLKSVVIPSSVRSIGPHAFSCCFKLESVNIPSSVTSIGRRAFFGSHLKSVTIPTSVTSIGEMAFGSCLALSINIPKTVKFIGKDAFFHCGTIKWI